MCMNIYTQKHTHTYTYIYACTYTRIHAHTYTYACICTRMHRLKILVTTSQRVKQCHRRTYTSIYICNVIDADTHAYTYHRRTYTSIYICMHIHKFINIHTFAQPAASVFADVYVGVKTNLCSVHTCPCTSVQSSCSKVHVTLTAETCTYIYTNTHMYMHTYVHEHTCASITPSTRWSQEEITLVYICRIRMRLYVIKSLNDIYMSYNL